MKINKFFLYKYGEQTIAAVTAARTEGIPQKLNKKKMKKAETIK